MIRSLTKVGDTMDAIPIRAAGGVLVKKENGEWMVLLIKKRQSELWMLPKGHLEAGETPEEASQREVTEETGFDVLVGPHIGAISFSYIRTSQLFQETVDFYLMSPKAKLDWRDEEEIQQAQWFTFEEADAVLAFPGELSILQEGRGRLDLR